MAEAQPLQAGTSTVTETEQTNSPAVVLKLRKPKNDKKVQWEEGTVDNEHMGKKKSKCCCIYEKPKLFGESSDEDSDDEGCSPHCRGHKKKCYQKLPPDSTSNGEGGASGPCVGASGSCGQ